jgi:hypothetical protein
MAVRSPAKTVVTCLLLLTFFPVVISARTIGKISKGLSYGDDVDLKEYTKAYLGDIEVVVIGKGKVASEAELTRHIKMKIKAELESSVYFAVVTSEPPLKESEEKWLRIDANLFLNPGSSNLRAITRGMAGVGGINFRIVFEDHKTDAQVAEYHSSKIVSGLGFTGGPVTIAKRHINRNTKRCAEFWGRALEDEKHPSAQ